MPPLRLPVLALAAFALPLAIDVHAQAVGYAAGTTGGGGRTPIVVSTPEQMRAAIDAYAGSGGLVIRYTGTFDFRTITDPCGQWTKDPVVVEIKDKSDITIEGAHGSTANFGIFIVGNSRNVIVRNMTIGLLPGGEGADSITIEGRGTGRVPERIWIDHNTIFASLRSCPGAGDASFDGGIDIKRGARFITVSYNHVFDYQKVALNGHTDGFPEHDAARTTYYRNRFENVQSRVPLQRFGLSHIANNYFGNITTSGINVRMGGTALIEANHFENVANPVTSRDSAQIGFWELRDNLVGSGITWSSPGGNTVNATNWQSTRSFPEPLGYTLPIAPAAQVKCLVFATAGAGTDLATSAPQCGTSPVIALTASASTSGINLAWTPSNLTPGTQEVFRDTDADPAGRTRVGSVASSARSYSDTTAVAGTPYWYWISTTVDGRETTSNAASATRSGSGGGTVDTIPDAFAFSAQTGVPVSSTVTSAPVAISGLTGAAPLSISEGTHSVGCTGTYTNAVASITNGQTVCLRHTSAARASVTTATTLTIGGVSAEFKSTTAASTRPQTANQFDLSGAWYEPSTAGQGLMVEMYTSTARGGAAPYLFAGWFTYTDRIGGVAEHDWYALEGTGTANGRVFPLTIGRPNANVFDNGAAAGAPVQLGTATLTFSSCTEAVLDYQFNAAGGSRSGQVVLQRLLSNVACDEATPVANAPRGFLNSGAWYEPATAGQGLLFELNPTDRQLFGAWYTFAASAPADYRWYTLQLGNVDPAATRLAAVPVFETTGGRFDRNETTSIRQVGEATIEFTGCTTGTLSYRFTVGELAGRTGDIPLSRVGPAPSECR